MWKKLLLTWVFITSPLLASEKFQEEVALLSAKILRKVEISEQELENKYRITLKNFPKGSPIENLWIDPRSITVIFEKEDQNKNSFMTPKLLEKYQALESNSYKLSLKNSEADWLDFVGILRFKGFISQANVETIIFMVESFFFYDSQYYLGYDLTFPLKLRHACSKKWKEYLVEGWNVEKISKIETYVLTCTNPDNALWKLNVNKNEVKVLLKTDSFNLHRAYSWHSQSLSSTKPDTTLLPKFEKFKSSKFSPSYCARGEDIEEFLDHCYSQKWINSTLRNVILDTIEILSTRQVNQKPIVHPLLDSSHPTPPSQSLSENTDDQPEPTGFFDFLKKLF